MFANRKVRTLLTLLVLFFSGFAVAQDVIGVAGLSRVIEQDFTSEVQRRFLGSGGIWEYPVSVVSTDNVAADSAQRTVAFGENVVVSFGGLKKDAVYKVRVEYLSDSDDRVLSLYADDVVLSENVKLPRGKVLAEVVDLPGSVFVDGMVELKFVKKGGPNAAVASVELWSNDGELLPGVDIAASGGLNGSISGVVVDINAGAPVAGASVVVSCDKFRGFEKTVSDDKGNFQVDLPIRWRDGELITVGAEKDGVDSVVYVPVEEVFKPRLTVLPDTVAGVKSVKVDLNGVWKFWPNCGDDLSGVSDMVAGKWYDIEVPGEWVMQGFEVEKERPAGYFRQFSVPADWSGKRIKLRCDAVYSDTTIWVNGQKAGGHKGGMTPFEIDVTKFVSTGNNTIAMTVTNESLADVLASGSQYAVHQLGGISRKIYLFAVEELSIASMHVETVFDEKFDDATMRVLLTVANEGRSDIDNASVVLGLRKSGSRKDVELKDNNVKLPLIKAGQSITRVVEIKVDSPAKWDCEHPNLYYLTCDLKKWVKRVSTVSRRFGFRQVEIRGNQLFVNNMPVKLHGVCRHEAHPLRGRSLTDEQWRADAELFRAANCNYIRTSHYPPAEEFIEYCDELGLFVEEEAPLCWVGHGANSTWSKRDPHSAAYLRTIVKATMEMIERDRSHPSIVIWSLANESQWGPNFARSFELANIADPTRPKAFHDQSWGGYNNNGSSTQVANFHYPGPGGFKNADKESSVRPQLFGEYCHLNAYNRNELFTDQSLRDAWGRGFEAMWDGMYETKGMLGGALWSGVDDSFFLPNGRVVGYGTWGPIDGWRRTKPEYWHTKKIYSPVRIKKTTIAKPSVGKKIELEVENRHDFTNISELGIDWSVGEAAGRASADIGPNSKGKLVIPYASNSEKVEKLKLTFTSPRGFVVDEYVITVGQEAEAGEISKTAAMPEVAQTGETITVSGEDFSYVIGFKTGMIVEGNVGGKQVITGGPHLMVLGLNSAGGTQMTGTDSYESYTEPLGDWQASEVNMSRAGNVLVIKAVGKYDKAEGSYSMSIAGDGTMTVDYDFVYNADINPRQIGLVFDLDGSCKTLKWKRRGQWSVYPADHIGRSEGVARAFVGSQKSGTAGPGFEPAWPWAHDANKMGTNDFRSTKENIYWATISDDDGGGIGLVSDGSDSVRCWVDGDKVRVLGANYVNPGAERFFRGHAAREDKPLKAGDKINGTIKLKPNTAEELVK